MMYQMQSLNTFLVKDLGFYGSRSETVVSVNEDVAVTCTPKQDPPSPKPTTFTELMDKVKQNMWFIIFTLLGLSVFLTLGFYFRYGRLF
jgi:hypothetical protein